MFELNVPDFFDVELAAVIWKKLRKGELDRSEADGLVSALAALPLIRHPDRDLIGKAFALAADTGRTVYDSVYLALAIRLGIELVTADERFRYAVAVTAWGQHDVWIEDIP